MWMCETQGTSFSHFVNAPWLYCNSSRYSWFLNILHPSCSRTRVGAIWEWQGLFETSLSSGEFESRNENDWGRTTFEWLTDCLSLILPVSFLVRSILTLCYTIGKKREVWKRIDCFKLHVWGLEVNKSMCLYKYYNLRCYVCSMYVSSIVKMNKWR